MIKFLHSSWAFIVLLTFLFTLINFLLGYTKNRIFNYAKDFRLATFTLIVFSIQIILGITAWFSSSYFTGIRQGHMGEYMTSAHDRLLVVEHPVMMLIAWLLTFYGYKRMKSAESSKKKFMAVILLYGIAFLLILVRIPWKTWL